MKKNFLLNYGEIDLNNHKQPFAVRQWERSICRNNHKQPFEFPVFNALRP